MSPNKMILPLVAGIAMVTLFAVDTVHAHTLNAIREAAVTKNAAPKKVTTADGISAANEISERCVGPAALMASCIKAKHVLKGVTVVTFTEPLVVRGSPASRIIAFNDEEAMSDMYPAPRWSN